jgi:hypothetical protein
MRNDPKKQQVEPTRMEPEVQPDGKHFWRMLPEVQLALVTGGAAAELPGGEELGLPGPLLHW